MLAKSSHGLLGEPLFAISAPRIKNRFCKANYVYCMKTKNISLAILALLSATTWAQKDNLAPSILPPNGLKANEVPVFVVIGSDDNHSAIADVAAILDSMRHADGTELKMTFYSNNTNDAVWTDDLAAAHAKGHEMALHTANHPDFTSNPTEIAKISEEISSNRTWISQQLGVSASQLNGFRTPFLALTDSVLFAVRQNGLLYDCSLEDGWQLDRNAKNYFWPYTMDALDKHSAWPAILNIGRSPEISPKLSSHPGIWQIPVYPFELMPDSVVEKYGLSKGWRAEVAKRFPDADPAPIGWKITGFDYNLWFQFNFTPAEFTALLQYNLDQRLAGNRAPLTIGIHANYYDTWESNGTERRAALETFVRNNAKNPNVRFVTAQQLIAWMKNPQKISPLQSQVANPSNSQAVDATGRSVQGVNHIELRPGQVNLRAQ
jgi:peptidoglycan/xylan/chitin deacetylase (PgdA/CDA1 family)